MCQCNGRLHNSPTCFDDVAIITVILLIMIIEFLTKILQLLLIHSYWTQTNKLIAQISGKNNPENSDIKTEYIDEWPEQLDDRIWNENSPENTEWNEVAK